MTNMRILNMMQLKRKSFTKLTDFLKIPEETIRAIIDEDIGPDADTKKRFAEILECKVSDLW
jgi:DNA-binding Xre family transcriptional regulator